MAAPSSIAALESFRTYLDKAMSYYCGDDEFKKYFGRVPSTRYYTFKYCIEHNPSVIVELGTSRSFVDGRFEGCNLSDTKYWKPYDMSVWDWSAGCFTRVFATCLPSSTVHTVDICREHIERCRYMNSDLPNIRYNIASSVDYLQNMDFKADLIYLDTGDMTPIEPTAQLQLSEARAVVERNLLNDGGILLLDDVRNTTPAKFGDTTLLGKSKYSLPYLTSHGFRIKMDEYQVVLEKI